MNEVAPAGPDEPVDPIEPTGLVAPAAPTPTEPDWERLSPLSPLLRGGVVLIAVGGWALSQLMNRIYQSVGVENVPGEAGPDFDKVKQFPLIALGILAAVLVVVIGGSWLVWRFTRFRVTPTHVELRHGLIFRQQRQVPLERIQAVEMRRPLLAQVLGLAQVVVQSAGGADAHLTLAYLSLARATAVRHKIQLAAARSDERLLGSAAGVTGSVGMPSAAGGSGGPTGAARASAAAGGHGIPAVPTDPAGRDAGQRVGLPGDLLGLGSDEGTPVLTVPNLRLFAATVLHSSLFFLVLMGLIFGGVYFFTRDTGWGVVAATAVSLPALIPVTLGIGWSRVNELLKHGNFRITNLGRALRVTHGLTDHRTTTIPLHRVQAMELRQSIWWRHWGWWRVQVNVAGVHGDHDGVTNETVVLPVGTLDQALAVLALLDPALELAHLRIAASGDGHEPGWTNAPRSARWLDPISWRRRGYTATGHMVLIRTGVLTRTVVVVPHARIQSLTLRQGPLQRWAGVVTVDLVSTVGPIKPRIEHLADADAHDFLVEEAARAARARQLREAVGEDAACAPAPVSAALVPDNPTPAPEGPAQREVDHA